MFGLKIHSVFSFVICVNSNLEKKFWPWLVFSRNNRLVSSLRDHQKSSFRAFHIGLWALLRGHLGLCKRSPHRLVNSFKDSLYRLVSSFKGSLHRLVSFFKGSLHRLVSPLKGLLYKPVSSFKGSCMSLCKLLRADCMSLWALLRVTAQHTFVSPMKDSPRTFRALRRIYACEPVEVRFTGNALRIYRQQPNTNQNTLSFRRTGLRKCRYLSTHRLCRVLHCYSLQEDYVDQLNVKKQIFKVNT